MRQTSRAAGLRNRARQLLLDQLAELQQGELVGELEGAGGRGLGAVHVQPPRRGIETSERRAGL